MTSKVQLLPKSLASLARGVPPAEPGTLFVLGATGGMSVAPDAGFPLVFGRNPEDAHICVGPGDDHVSRQHGHITRAHERWLLNNTGRLPIRLPGSRLLLGGDQVPLETGFSPLFIMSPRQEHLLEVRIAGPGAIPAEEDWHDAETRDGKVWDLTDVEKLVLVCLCQRYLRGEAQPQPITWGQVADELAVLSAGQRWTAKRVAHIVSNVRQRLSRSVSGLVEAEVPQPVGNALNHNLIMELLVTATISKADLYLLDDQRAPR